MNTRGDEKVSRNHPMSYEVYELTMCLCDRDMDSKEQSEKLKNYEAQYANYLKAKYFSDKDIYGGKIQN